MTEFAVGVVEEKAVRQPALFLPHGGGPCFFMDWTWGPADTWVKTRDFLAGLAATLPARPKAMVVVSGHWEERAFTVSTAERPGMIYDYSGFPEHTYRLSWPAPGSPELAARVVELLKAAGLPVATAERGFDHGTFVPLMVAFPEAEIPVVTVSLQRGLDPALHLAAGKALAALRDEGVLIVGSGNSWHNLRGYMQADTLRVSQAFDDWLTPAVLAGPGEREELLKRWAEAPFALAAHPREEHLLPLMVAAGAGDGDQAERIFTDSPMRAVISAYRFG